MKITIISIIVSAALIGVVLIFTAGNGSNGLANNVSVVDGKQIISITAKGGYSPRITTAKAGLPTVIEVDTKNTFDCSSALVIPNLSYRNILPATGETAIEVPPQAAGSVLKGICAMGMYNFQIRFN